jgi:hypothetical protein
MGKGLHSHGGIKEMIKVIPRKDLNNFIFFFSNEARAIGGSFPFLIRMEERMGDPLENASKNKMGSDLFS